jgi:hypothetical protein
VPFHPGEILSNEIQGDADLEGIYDNNNEDDDNAFNPPGSMRSLDDALVDQPSSVLLYENHPLPVDAKIAVGGDILQQKGLCECNKKFPHQKLNTVSH